MLGSCLMQLDEQTLDATFTFGASSMHEHSPMTPQEDYTNPKSRCLAAANHFSTAASPDQPI